MFVAAGRADRLGAQFADGADLVLEVVSEGNRAHDLETKRAEYAEAGIRESWIVDPATERVIILSLAGGAYAVHGEFAPGETADSPSPPGFAVDVAAMFAASRR